MSRRAVILFFASLILPGGAMAQQRAPAPAAPPTPTVPPPRLQRPLPAATPTTPPTTQPSGNRSAEEMLRQMPQPQGQAAQPLKPIADLPPPVDATSGAAAVVPTASTQPVVREGTLLLDRI